MIKTKTMKVKIIRDYGALKAGQIVDATGNTSQYLLSNGIAVMAPKDENCIGDCDDPEHECEGCKSKKKRRTATVGAKMEQPETKPAKVQETIAPKADNAKKPKAKKKSNKKTASPKK